MKTFKHSVFHDNGALDVKHKGIIYGLSVQLKDFLKKIRYFKLNFLENSLH